MIVEYLPRNIETDLGSIIKVLEMLHRRGAHVSHVLIPQNPVDKIYPCSVVASALLREKLDSVSAGSGIGFIPTAKGSMLSEEGFRSMIKALRYTGNEYVAIISGNKGAGLSTKQMLGIAEGCRLNVFCAVRSKKDMETKVKLGVKNFMTQPFFSVRDFESFKEKLGDTSGVNIYCSIIVLPSHEIAASIEEKRIGIKIPKSFMKRLKSDKSKANKTMLDEMSCLENTLVEYIRYEDLMESLQC